MAFLSGIRDGWLEAREAHRLRMTPAEVAAEKLKKASPAAGEPSPIKFGYYHDRKQNQVRGDVPLFFHGERHVVLFGLNGAGKTTRFLIELLATVAGRSLVVLDIKGELAFQTAVLRLGFGAVKFINPYRMHGLPSHGFNPLAQLGCDDPRLYDKAAAIADALIEIEEGSGQYWSESAQGLLVAIIMWEVILADREHRTPSLINVRLMMTEPEESESYIDDDGRPKLRLVKGLKVLARRMVAEGNATMRSLIGRFMREEGQNELSGIQSTADTQTQWMLSDAMRTDLSAPDGVDFRELRRRPVTVFVMLPAGEITLKRKWSRVVMASALGVHLEPAPMKTLFILDEFKAAIGSLSVCNNIWSLIRGFGAQLMPILQSAIQLQTLFKDEWENYPAQSGVVATLGPPNDMFTAKWMSERCGVTTIMQAGFNLGDGVNAGSGINASSGQSGMKGSSNQSSGSNFGHSTSGGLSYQQTERRVFLPNELMDLPPGHGRLWLPGMGTRSIPFFAPNYWQRHAPWVAHVKPNPLRPAS